MRGLRCVAPIDPAGPMRAATATAMATVATAAASATGINDRLKDDMKTAMKAKEAAKLNSIRFLQAAIKTVRTHLHSSYGPKSLRHPACDRTLHGSLALSLPLPCMAL